MRWALWELVELEDDRVTVGYRLHPQPGWDHFLDLRTTYLLDDSGLVVTTAARNVGPSAAPFGYGAHPYLAIGDTLLPDVELRIPAATWVEVDERLLPAATHPVDGGPYDFRDGARVDGARLDTAYTDVLRDEDGLWRCTVAAADRTTTLWADAAFPWLQVFTAIAEDRKGEVGIAVEPMTLPGRRLQLGRRARRARAGRGVDRHLGHQPRLRRRGSGTRHGGAWHPWDERTRAGLGTRRVGARSRDGAIPLRSSR